MPFYVVFYARPLHVIAYITNTDISWDQIRFHRASICLLLLNVLNPSVGWLATCLIQWESAASAFNPTDPTDNRDDGVYTEETFR